MRRSGLCHKLTEEGAGFSLRHTPIETAKLNGVDPQAWLTDTLGRISDHKINHEDSYP